MRRMRGVDWAFAGWQVVTKTGEVAFDDIWVFGHADADAACDFHKIEISPVLSTTSPPQVPHHRTFNGRAGPIPK